MDSLIVSIPVQGNTRQDNEAIKAGEVPEDWKDKPNKLRQKEVDVRWTKNGLKNYHGYNNHISTDCEI